jgi:hypothetical protein
MAHSTFFGLIIYDVLPNGCLNGVYSNDDARLDIGNEIAKKNNTNVDIDGDYSCAWIELGGNPPLLAALEVRNNNGVYEFIWRQQNGNNEIFRGHGIRLNNQIAVVYWRANQPVTFS